MLWAWQNIPPTMVSLTDIKKPCTVTTFDMQCDTSGDMQYFQTNKFNIWRSHSQINIPYVSFICIMILVKFLILSPDLGIKISLRILSVSGRFLGLKFYLKMPTHSSTTVINNLGKSPGSTTAQTFVCLPPVIPGLCCHQSTESTAWYN